MINLAAAAAMHVPIFRIFYSTTYTVLLLVTLGLLVISPADAIYQSYLEGQDWNIVIVAGVYLLTFLVAAFVYATRLYTTRAHLAAIPKSALPLRKGDVPAKVRRMILAGIERSASIAYAAYPRELSPGRTPPAADGGDPAGTRRRSPLAPAVLPHWGAISHPGWCSSSSPDLPNLHYAPVLSELPHLLEARAVSLAPPDPFPLSDDGPRPSPLAVSVLQRPVSSPLRAYLSHLLRLRMLRPPSLASEFLGMYESARFATRPLHEREFRSLMDAFAKLLSGMTAPDPATLAALADDLSASASSASSPSPSPSATSSSFSARSSLAPPRRPRTSRSAPEIDDSRPRSSSSSVLSPYPTRTAFHTPYLHPLPARSASTASLAGSEATVHTAPSRAAPTPSRTFRTPSAWTVRSERSERILDGTRYGLGLELSGSAEVGNRLMAGDVDAAAGGGGGAAAANDDDDDDDDDDDKSTEIDGDDSEATGSVRIRRRSQDGRMLRASSLTDSMESTESGGSVVRTRRARTLLELPVEMDGRRAFVA